MRIILNIERFRDIYAPGIERVQFRTICVQHPPEFDKFHVVFGKKWNDLVSL